MERDLEGYPDDRKIEKRSEHVKWAKKAKDRHGVQRTRETCLDESETEWLQHYRRSHRETPASGRRRSPRRRREEHAEPDDGFEWDGVSGEGEK